MSLDERRLLADRERVLSALVTAQGHGREVLDAIWAAGDTDAAMQALHDLFGFDQAQATVVLDSQLRRYSNVERASIAEELADVRRQLAALG